MSRISLGRYTPSSGRTLTQTGGGNGSQVIGRDGYRIATGTAIAAIMAWYAVSFHAFPRPQQPWQFFYDTIVENTEGKITLVAAPNDVAMPLGFLFADHDPDDYEIISLPVEYPALSDAFYTPHDLSGVVMVTQESIVKTFEALPKDRQAWIALRDFRWWGALQDEAYGNLFDVIATDWICREIFANGDMQRLYRLEPGSGDGTCRADPK